jgi:hypothetical protein
MGLTLEANERVVQVCKMKISFYLDEITYKCKCLIATTLEGNLLRGRTVLDTV